jgi:predicted AAA+ superfamily ATPase
MAAFGEFGPFSRWRTGSYRAIGRDYTELGRLCNGPGMKFQEPISGLIERMALALERLSPIRPQSPDFERADAFVFQAENEAFTPIKDVNRVPLGLLKGIDRNRNSLQANTERFAKGLPGNNALLWGARGTGKSSLVKAVHAAFPGLKLIEIHREDIAALPQLLKHLREAPEHRFILFCDDLSFEAIDTSYKSLKALLEGGIEGRPANVLLYATSNRRHLMPREMVENERSTAINPSEAVEEKLSLSDRFGLWIGFHNCSQGDYLAMVRGYAEHYRLDYLDADLQREALEWARGRGGRSGRVAWQFIQDLAGRLGATL